MFVRHDERRSLPEFERRLDEAFRDAGIRYTMHWSKNSGIRPDKLEYMYGVRKIVSWKVARQTVFNNDQTLMKLFETDATLEAGLARPVPTSDVSDEGAMHAILASAASHLHAPLARFDHRAAETIDTLVNPLHIRRASDAFDVVVPSMPGFSGKPTNTGWDVAHIARAWIVLMKRLGYTIFVAKAAMGRDHP